MNMENPTEAVKSRAAENGVRERNAEAVDVWLLKQVADGPITSVRLHELAALAGYGRNRLFAARRRLYGKIRTRKLRTHWVWEAVPQHGG